jgi:hypothetical protein
MQGQGLGYVREGAVYGAFFLLFFSLLAPLVLGQRGSSRVMSWSLGAVVRTVLWLIHAFIMAVVNTLVLMIRLTAAALGTGDVIGRAADAVTTYLERMADLLVSPLGRAG